MEKKLCHTKSNVCLKRISDMTLIKKYKKYLRTSAAIWIVCLIVFALSYFIVMSPQYKTRNKIEKELAESKKIFDLAEKASEEDTKIRLNSDIELLQSKLNNFVLDFKSAEDLAFDISSIAGESSVSSFNIQSDDVRAASASADPNTIFEKHIKVSFIAGFQEFALFLNSLERHQPVLFVNGFTLSRHNNDNTTYQVTLDIAALVKKQQVAKTKDDDSMIAAGTKL